jgi:hypothetical protein
MTVPSDPHTDLKTLLEKLKQSGAANLQSHDRIFNPVEHTYQSDVAVELERIRLRKLENERRRREYLEQRRRSARYGY